MVYIRWIQSGFLVCFLVLLWVGCSSSGTEVNRIGLTPESLQPRGPGGAPNLTELNRLMNRSFEMEGNRGSSLRGIAGLAFVLQGGAEAMYELSEEQKSQYEGLQQFQNEADERRGYWAYLAQLSIQGQNQESVADFFDPRISREHFHNLALAGYLVREFIQTDRLTEVPRIQEEEGVQLEGPLREIGRANLHLLTTQYYRRSLGLLDRYDWVRDEIESGLNIVLNNWNSLIDNTSVSPRPAPLRRETLDQMANLLSMDAQLSMQYVFGDAGLNPPAGDPGASMPFGFLFDERPERWMPHLRSLDAAGTEKMAGKRERGALEQFTRGLYLVQRIAFIMEFDGDWLDASERETFHSYRSKIIQGIRVVQTS